MDRQVFHHLLFSMWRLPTYHINAHEQNRLFIRWIPLSISTDLSCRIYFRYSYYLVHCKVHPHSNRKKMKKSFESKIALFTDKTFMKFVLVGIVNVTVGATIMFVFYNVFHFSYLVSSASNYFFGSIVSYFLNKYFTFKFHEKGWWSIVKFTLNIVVCYIIAYSIAKPMMQWMLSDFSMTVQENVSMAVGMCLFTALNYLGQRFFAFHE